jgi:hypothetical protein
LYKIKRDFDLHVKKKNKKKIIKRDFDLKERNIYVKNIYVLFFIFCPLLHYHGTQPIFFVLPFFKSFAVLDTFKPVEGELSKTHIVK